MPTPARSESAADAFRAEYVRRAVRALSETDDAGDVLSVTSERIDDGDDPVTRVTFTVRAGSFARRIDWAAR